jgi:hypothetical protein
VTRPIGDLDVPLPVLVQQLREAGPDPRVGLNPTGRPRRSSAPSRRKQNRRTTTKETP